ncbi:MAG: DegT/DnrJ/EryC1/StrS aminotransferase family protein [Cyclobacteriaceae bacterium]|nr:DegT/DnrJ/EryC1/StrS aminotransferase family protein [Cyclobacteriaceae bacterium]
MIIDNPDPYLLPTYRMSPFSTADVHKNANLKVKTALIEMYLEKRFDKRNYVFTASGKSALYAALEYYHLKPRDVVTILTTSGNFYISSCVTGEIEKFCRWSRKIEKETKLVLVNHEFGYPVVDMEAIEKLGFPIIEDCAYSFLSGTEAYGVGEVGDFAIYSFPKLFPVQIGGLLTAKSSIAMDLMHDVLPDKEELVYLKTVLSAYIDTTEEIAEKRRKNYRELMKRLVAAGCTERFAFEPGIVPGACLFKVPEKVDLPAMKTFLWSRGIQCSVFYGEQAFFVPVHQKLENEDIAYISKNIYYFIEKNSL